MHSVHSRRVLRCSIVSLAFAALFASQAEAGKTPVCTAPGLAAMKKIPQMKLTCGDDQEQVCKTDSPGAALTNPECAAAGASYERLLRPLLTPQWWSAPAESLEACRVHKKVGTLESLESESLDEYYGEQIQGTDRVRLLILGDACDVAGHSNDVIVVRTATGIAVTPIYLDFYQGGQEAPLDLAVATNGGNTFALVSQTGHDIQDMYVSTTAYRIDPVTGKAVPYPLYETVAGDRSELDMSEPIGPTLNEDHTSEVENGKFAAILNNHQANDCTDGDAKCAPIRNEVYTWNGKQFVIQGYDIKHAAYLKKLTAFRACMKSKFDPKSGAADCGLDFQCEMNNDLSFLNLKAGSVDRALNAANEALGDCRGSAREYSAAVYNYMQAVKAKK